VGRGCPLPHWVRGLGLGLITVTLTLEAKKQSRKLPEFWLVMGNHVRRPPDATEKLMKNLSHEFQLVKKMQQVSGAGTTVPQLRGSELIFCLFDEYYQLYFPHGGSILPKIVMTEKALFQ